MGQIRLRPSVLVFYAYPASIQSQIYLDLWGSVELKEDSS